MLRHLVRGLCAKSSGRTLVACAIGVLAGVECLLAKELAPLRAPSRRVPVRRAVPRTDYFQIRRSRFDLGYTYWVLQGFGCYRGFALFDTWREAMEEAEARILRRRMREEEAADLSIAGR